MEVIRDLDKPALQREARLGGGGAESGAQEGGAPHFKEEKSLSFARDDTPEVLHGVWCAISLGSTALWLVSSTSVLLRLGMSRSLLF